MPDRWSWSVDSRLPGCDQEIDVDRRSRSRDGPFQPPRSRTRPAARLPPRRPDAAPSVPRVSSNGSGFIQATRGPDGTGSTYPGVVPTQPPPCEWQFPPPEAADSSGLGSASGPTCEPATVLIQAYRSGLCSRCRSETRGPDRLVGSPDPRAILELDDLVVHQAPCADPVADGSRSEFRHRLRRRGRRRAPTRVAPTAGSTNRCSRAYHRAAPSGLGPQRRDPAATVASWVGCTVMATSGGLFAAESMFHHERDASKVALLALVEIHPKRSATPPPRRPVAVPIASRVSLGVTEIQSFANTSSGSQSVTGSSPHPSVVRLNPQIRS